MLQLPRRFIAVCSSNWNYEVLTKSNPCTTRLTKSCVPVHKGVAIVFSLFRIHWLCVVDCLVFCIGSYKSVHGHRTLYAVFLIESHS